MASFLREPLVQFVLLGAFLFAAYAVLHREDPSVGGRIVVSAGKIEHLAALFTRTWQRPPTRGELHRLVDEFVREEAAYRAGLAMGLDRNDAVIRRRIRQKLEFVADELTNQLEPNEQELAAFLRDQPDRFRVEPRISFRQVYFDGARDPSDVDRAISELRDDPSLNVETIGDPTLTRKRYEDVTRREIVEVFGEGFASALANVEVGAWQGPIASAYGVHAVLLEESHPGRLPQLAEIREAVRREWEHDRRKALIDEFYAGLLKDYDVVVEWPTSNGTEEEP